MKTIMISIQSNWVQKIINGEKILEIRKTRPKCDLPIKCLIYCNKAKPDFMLLKSANGVFKLGHLLNGKVVGEFTCKNIKEFFVNYFDDEFYYGITYFAQMSAREINNYLGGTCKVGYAWGISNLKIYDKPKDLSEFNLKRPPQSWQYLGEENENDND